MHVHVHVTAHACTCTHNCTCDSLRYTSRIRNFVSLSGGHHTLQWLYIVFVSCTDLHLAAPEAFLQITSWPPPRGEGWSNQCHSYRGIVCIGLSLSLSLTHTQTHTHTHTHTHILSLPLSPLPLSLQLLSLPIYLSPTFHFPFSLSPLSFSIFLPHPTSHLITPPHPTHQFCDSIQFAR